MEVLLGCLCLLVRRMKGTVRAGYSAARIKQKCAEAEYIVL